DSTGYQAFAGMVPNSAQICIASGFPVDRFVGFSGPSNFGGGGLTFANINSGVSVTLLGPTSGQTGIYLPVGYVSNTALLDSSTYNNATFASLGLTPGTYEWTWGDGGRNQNFTLVIGTVPDGGTTISLLGCALVGLAALRRKLGC